MGLLDHLEHFDRLRKESEGAKCYPEGFEITSRKSESSLVCRQKAMILQISASVASRRERCSGRTWSAIGMSTCRCLSTSCFSNADRCVKPAKNF